MGVELPLFGGSRSGLYQVMGNHYGYMLVGLHQVDSIERMLRLVYSYIIRMTDFGLDRR